jgi:hypothetical protein
MTAISTLNKLDTISSSINREKVSGGLPPVWDLTSERQLLAKKPCGCPNKNPPPKVPNPKPNPPTITPPVYQPKPTPVPQPTPTPTPIVPPKIEQPKVQTEIRRNIPNFPTFRVQRTEVPVIPPIDQEPPAIGEVQPLNFTPEDNNIDIKKPNFNNQPVESAG